MNFNAKSVIFSHKRQNRVRSYALGNITLLSAESFTYLGVTVSSDLKWHEHVAAISAKATRLLNLLRRNINFFSSEVETVAFTSLVRPHLEYASASWDPYTARDTQQLEGVQRRGHVLFIRISAYHPSLSATVRPQLVTLVIFYKGLHGICPLSLDHPRRPTRITRSVDGLAFIQIFILPKDSYQLQHTAIYYPISFICQLPSQLSAPNAWCSPDTLPTRRPSWQTGSKGCAPIAGLLLKNWRCIYYDVQDNKRDWLC